RGAAVAANAADRAVTREQAQIQLGIAHAPLAVPAPAEAKTAPPAPAGMMGAMGGRAGAGGQMGELGDEVGRRVAGLATDKDRKSAEVRDLQERLEADKLDAAGMMGKGFNDLSKARRRALFAYKQAQGQEAESRERFVETAY